MYFGTSDFHTDTAERALDYSTLVGIAIAFGLVTAAIVLGGAPSTFFDLNSVLIVFGGTIGATCINFSVDDVLRSMGGIRAVLWPDEQSGLLRIRTLTELALRVKSDGLLVLEQALGIEPDPFFRKGLQLVVDGLNADDVRHTLEIEMLNLDERHRRSAQVFQTMGTVAPAMGLIGTLIGLVQMLQQLNDPTKIGPGMATALLTTFYGAMLSYVLFTPLAGKLRMRSEEELLLKQLTVEGLAGIIQQVNPRLLEQRLFGFVAPPERLSRYDGGSFSL